MKSRVIKLNVNLEVLPCFVDKLFANFPATSCSDSISVCDKEKMRADWLFIYNHRQKKLYVIVTEVRSLNTHVGMDVNLCLYQQSLKS